MRLKKGMIMSKYLVTYTKYGNLINNLVEKIKNCDFAKGHELKYIYGIPKGGLPIAVHLAHHLGLYLIDNKPMFSEKIRTFGYKNILVVDDVADTGKTLEEYSMFTSATLFYKKQSTIEPTFYVETTDKWIVFPWETLEEVPNRPGYE